jgi:hypothetical protein
MPSNRPFVPVDADGWPILDDAILTPDGWEAPTTRTDDWPSEIARPATEKPITPLRSETIDPLEGFVFPKRRRRRIRMMPVVLSVLVLTFGGLAWYGTHRPGVPVAAIRPGNCLMLPGKATDLPGRRLTRFDRVDCGAAHNAEVFNTTNFDTSAPFPGVDAVTRTATTICQSAVPPAIRIHPDAPGWNVVFFGPISASTYHQGQVSPLLCVVSFPANRTEALHG